MNCPRYRRDLTELALGGPAPDEAIAHADVCAACRDELARLRRLQVRIGEEMRDLLLVEPSPAFMGRVRRRLDEGQPKHRAIVWLVPVAAALAIASLGTGLLPWPAPVVPAASPGQAAVESPAPAVPQREVAIRPRVGRARGVEPPHAPEVLVHVDQRELLLRLVREMGKQAVTLPPEESSKAVPVEVGRIHMPSIELVPLALESARLEPLHIESGEDAS